MANIRVSALAVPVLAAALSAGTVSASQSVQSVSASVRAPGIAASVFLVPLRVLEEQTVGMSDFRAFDIGQVSIDVATATEDVAITTEKALTDSVTVVETAFRAINSTIDFDPSDSDADPDPIFVVEADAKDVGKILTDTAAATDADVKTVDKSESDSVSVAEAINTKNVGKNLTDAATAADAVNEFAVDKPLTDAVTAAEASAKELTRPDVADAVTAADDSFRSPGLGKTDSVTAADAVNTLDIGKNPSDSVSAAETDAKSIDKPLTDTVLMTDILVKTPAYIFDYDTLDADADPDPVTVAEAANYSVGKYVTDSFSMSDAITSFDVSKILANSVTVAESIALELILGETTAIYPDYVSMDDGDNFVFHRYKTTVPDYTEVLGNGMFNAEYMQSSSDSHTFENYTGLINGPGLLLTAPLIGGEFITYGSSTGAGFVVNFHYTDAADRTVGGYYFNQTPIL